MNSPVVADAAATLAALGGGAARGAGAVDAVQSLVPGATTQVVALVVALVTQVGDPWFLGLLLVGCYWAAPRTREDVAVVSGLALAALALVLALKHAFAFPRPGDPLVALAALPPYLRPLYELTGTASGYGFPSGHALGTTVVFVGLATLLPGGSGRRVAGAAAVVGVVSLSRVALGVHYLVDVLAGVAVGLAVLLVARAALDRVPTDRPTAAFGAGVGLGGVALVATRGSADAVLLLGAALGAFGGWQLLVLGRTPLGAGPAAAAGPALRRGGLAAAAALPLWCALEYGAVLSTLWLGGAVGAAVAVLVVVPPVRESDRTRVVLAAAAFWGVAALRELRHLVADRDLPGWPDPEQG